MNGVRTFLVSFSATLLAILAFLWPLLVPFAPYQSYGYEVLPRSVCPGDLVRVTVDREVEAAFYAEVERQSVVSEWRAKDGRIVPAGDVPDIPLSEHPRKKAVSPVVREAPGPGEWRLLTRSTVEGRVWWARKTQNEFVQRSEDRLVVKDCGE